MNSVERGENRSDRLKWHSNRGEKEKHLVEEGSWQGVCVCVCVCVCVWWGGTSEERACPFIDIFTYERSVSSDRLTESTAAQKAPGRSSPQQKGFRENIHIPAATDPVETHCISLIRDTLSRLCLFSRRISVEPQRQTLAAYSDPKKQAGNHCTDIHFGFLSFQPVCWSAGAPVPAIARARTSINCMGCGVGGRHHDTNKPVTQRALWGYI